MINTDIKLNIDRFLDSIYRDQALLPTGKLKSIQNRVSEFGTQHKALFDQMRQLESRLDGTHRIVQWIVKNIPFLDFWGINKLQKELSDTKNKIEEISLSLPELRKAEEHFAQLIPLSKRGRCQTLTATLGSVVTMGANLVKGCLKLPILGINRVATSLSSSRASSVSHTISQGREILPLTGPVQEPVSSSQVASAPAKSPGETLLHFMQGVPNFDQVPGIEQWLKSGLPEGTTVSIHGDLCTVGFSSSPSYAPNREKVLDQDTFDRFNRMRDGENLAQLADMIFPDDNQKKELSKIENPKVRDLWRIRSIGAKATQGALNSRATLPKKIVLKKTETGLEFAEGAPTISGATLQKISFNESEKSLREKEGGIITVQSKYGWVPMPAAQYFVQDLKDLFNLIYERVYTQTT